MKQLIKLQFVVLLFTNTHLLAQSKMNFNLAQKVSTSSTPIDVLVQGNIPTIQQLTETVGGTFKYAAGNIASIKIPASALANFANNKAVQRLEAYPQRNKPMNDTMLINNNVIPVHNGTAPLTQAYDGSGIVIGFIDTGIDFTHPDFQDSTNHSRIKFLWDQTLPTASNTPSYGYGQEWTNTQIDSGFAAAHNDLNYSGHGTHVAGVAAGNGLATGNYKGVAPKSDIIMVALDFSSSSTSLITDAVDYIYSKAQLLGKPCVINASVGDYYGSHDGTDLQAQLIKNEIIAQPGRAFVSAAGNGGGYPFHVGYTVNSDTNFTWFSNSPQIYIPMYADTADMDSLEFAIGADEMSPIHSFRGRTNFSKINNHTLGVIEYDTIYNGSNRIATLMTYADLVAGVYSMEFIITPDSTNYNFRLMTTGNGKFDCWTFDTYLGTMPTTATLPDSIFYKAPDTDETIVSSFNCLDNVISVGNYMNRAMYIDYTGTPYINNGNPPGQLSTSSSHGPTRDGRIKPDICSPGDMTVAAVVLSLVPSIVSGFPDALAQGGFHIRDGGTSHAAPSVAGIAALYLQKDPTATSLQILNDIICSAKEDTLTGHSLPNNQWGYGKANAFGALVGCLPTGINQTVMNTSINIYPNPTANGSITIAISTTDDKSKLVLKIVNTLGELVKETALSANQTRVELQLSNGLYFCTVLKDGKPINSQKLVVMN